MSRTDEQKPSLVEVIKQSVVNQLKDLHTNIPGIIRMYDSESQTATIAPAIKRVLSTLDGEVEKLTPIGLPALINVPILFQQSATLCLTMPIEQGDECLIFFSERSIDNWYREGGIQEPSNWRMHDLSDAFAVVGPVSSPNKIQSVSATASQLRTKAVTGGEPSSYISIEGGSETIDIITKTSDINIEADGDINIEAVGDVNIDAKNINITASQQVTVNATVQMNITAPLVVIIGNTQQTGSIVATAGIACGVIGVVTPEANKMKATDMEASNGMTAVNAITASDVTGTNSVKDGAITVGTHLHTGVTPGLSNTGGPI